jgi:hypothetical protein
LLLFCVRETGALHFFGGSIKAFGAYVIHGKKAEGLRKRYTVSASLQKFNVRVDPAENRTQSDFPGASFGERSFRKQNRSPGQGKALDRTQEFLFVDGKNCSLLVGDPDPGWPNVLGRFGDLSRHCKQDYNWIERRQCYLSASVKMHAAQWSLMKRQISPRNYSVIINAYPEPQLILIPAGLLQTKYASYKREFRRNSPIGET